MSTPKNNPKVVSQTHTYRVGDAVVHKGQKGIVIYVYSKGHLAIRWADGVETTWHVNELYMIRKPT